MKLENEKIEKLVKNLKKLGAVEIPAPLHASHRLKLKNGELIIYKSGSLVYAGRNRNDIKQEVIELVLEMEGEFPQIGCDEAGKGEFFGPLVVACVCAEKSCFKRLLEIEVKDSKKLRKESILELANEIKNHCHGTVRVIWPEQYNRLYEKLGNLNRLLENVYLDTLKKLLKRCKARKILVDKFSKKVEEFLKEEIPGIEITAKVKGESNPVIAAASIIAKAERLKAIEKLSKELGFKVNEGNLNNRDLLEKIPKEMLHRYVKLHFKVEEKK